MSETTTHPENIPVADTERIAAPASRWGRLLARLGVTANLVRAALVIWLLTRAGFILVTFLALHFLRRIDPQTHAFLSAWARYDATYYARLAVSGYQASVPWRTAFFPLQVLATALFRPLAGGNPYLASILVANASCFAALLGMAALTLHDTDERTARRAMLYLAIFPTALFLFAGYAESLFLALAIWSLVAMRRGGWWQAGLLGVLATLTRQMGLFLVLPFAYEYAVQHRWRLKALRLDALAILLIPSGLLLFMTWLWHAVDDPLAFSHAESYWHHYLSPPWQTLASGLRLWNRGPDAIFAFKDIMDIAAVTLFALLIVAAIRYLRPGDTLYCAAVWLLAICFPTLGWPLQSDARYMLAAFPCFMLLARAGRRPWLHALIVAVFAILLAVMTQYFVRGALIV